MVDVTFFSSTHKDLRLLGPYIVCVSWNPYTFVFLMIYSTFGKNQVKHFFPHEVCMFLLRFIDSSGFEYPRIFAIEIRCSCENRFVMFVIYSSLETTFLPTKQQFNKIVWMRQNQWYKKVGTEEKQYDIKVYGCLIMNFLPI